MTSNLTPKREKFAQKFVELADQSAAYRAAFDTSAMKDKTIWEAASRLARDSKVAARIAELQDKSQKRHEITVDRVLKEYARLAFLDIRKAFDEEGKLKPIHEMDDDTVAAIAGLEVETLFEGRGQDRELVGRLHKIKLSDKKGALDSLAKHLGILVERREISGPDGGPIITQSKEQRDAAVAAALAADT